MSNYETQEQMLGVEVCRMADLPRTHEHEDLALEYSIRTEPQSMSGIIVYGRYENGWWVNPNLRPVVAELLRRAGIQV